MAFMLEEGRKRSSGCAADALLITATTPQRVMFRWPVGKAGEAGGGGGCGMLGDRWVLGGGSEVVML
jgi:hypothetical protein